MLLSAILDADPPLPPRAGSIEITGITADSRQAGPAFLYFAIPGVGQDGAHFAADAVARGAVAVVAALASPVRDDLGVPVIRVPEPRRALAIAAARFYGPQPATIVAVTGTAGKTSVAEFTRQIFAHAGHKAASIGTIGIVTPNGTVYGSLTTPDPITLAKTLADLHRQGITHVAMEASSHGLDQHRADGVTVAAGAFTNLGRDHMDYHPTVGHYFDAKMRLFRELLPAGAPAVVNTDGAYADDAIRVARQRGLDIVTVGTRGKHLRLVSVTREGFKQRLAIEVPAKGITRAVLLPLVGLYQVENALTAAALAHVFDGALPILDALAHLQGVPGRLDIVGEARGGLAIVDYAHKPEALDAALASVRPFATGRLICVFGCGGDRDTGKRPIMGAIAAKGADIVIVTDDNPRSEVPASIRAAILAAAPGARDIGDRAEAIHTAIAMMDKGDVVLIAGKGHETGQIVAATVLPFSDHAVVAAALAEVRS